MQLVGKLVDKLVVVMVGMKVDSTAEKSVVQMVASKVGKKETS